MPKAFHILNTVLLCASVTLHSCSTTSRTAKHMQVLDTISISSKGPKSIYRAIPSKTWELIENRVDLRFDYIKKEAHGQLVLSAHPYAYATNALQLDAKNILIHAVSLYPDISPLQYQYQSDTLSIQLPRHYQNTDTLRVQINYTTQTYKYASGGSSAISEDRGLYFINTDNTVAGKPAQIWTQGETESNSMWLPTIDRPNQRAKFEISLHVADSFTTLSNGALVKSIKEADNMRNDIWRIEEPIQVYAAMFAIGRFDKVKDKDWNKKEVSYYVEPQYKPYASTIFNHTPEMIQFFSDKTGIPFPWNKYSQIAVRDYVSGAMENTTASLFGEFVNKNHRELADAPNDDIVAHELFHQWFGDYATCASWSNLTVNESFANYSETLWRRYKYGNYDADQYLNGRMRAYLGFAQYKDPALVRYYYDKHEDMFDPISYSKGGCILHYLNGLLGDEVFSKAMQIYLSENALQSATAQHWQQAVEKASGRDWNWFFKQWYYLGGHPQLDIQYNYNDTAQQLQVIVAQKQERTIYRLPFICNTYNGNSVQSEIWTVENAIDTINIPYGQGSRPVVGFDAANWIVGTKTENKSSSLWLQQYRLAQCYMDKYNALRSCLHIKNDADKTALVQLALKDEFYGFREQALKQLEKENSEKIRADFNRQILWMAEHDGSNKVRAAAWDVCGSWKLKEVLSFAKEAIYDSSYAVAGAALNALARMDPATAISHAAVLREQQPEADLFTAVYQTLALDTGKGNYDMFTNAIAARWDGKKRILIQSFSKYLGNAVSDTDFTNGIHFLKDCYKQEASTRNRMHVFFAMQSIYEAYKGAATKENKARFELLKQAYQDLENWEQVASLKKMFKGE